MKFRPLHDPSSSAALKERKESLTNAMRESVANEAAQRIEDATGRRSVSFADRRSASAMAPYETRPSVNTS